MIDYRLVAEINCMHIMEVNAIVAGCCVVDIVCAHTYEQINPNQCKNCGYRNRGVLK